MTAWQPGDTAPRDGTLILVYGQPDAHPNLQVTFCAPLQFTAHYDAIDDAFCINGGDWMGPFVVPLFWMPLPVAPEASA